MPLMMDKPTLETFLSEQFAQVADQFAVEAVSENAITMRLRVGYNHLRPGGTISGPSMFALADCGMYAAILSHLGKEALAVTTNCAIDFMRKPEAGRDLYTICRIHKLGRVLVVGDAMIYSDGVEKPVARASLTYSIPPKRVA